MPSGLRSHVISAPVLRAQRSRRGRQWGSPARTGHGPPAPREVQARRDRRQGDRDVGGERYLVLVAPRERRERTLQGPHPREDVLEPHVVGSALRAPRVEVLLQIRLGSARHRAERRADQVGLVCQHRELVPPAGEIPWGSSPPPVSDLSNRGHEPLEPGRRASGQVEIGGELRSPRVLLQVDSDFDRHAPGVQRAVELHGLSGRCAAVLVPR